MSRVTVGEPLAGSRDMARFFGQGQALSLHRKENNPMKTPKKLNALKKEVETLSEKPHELTEEELEKVSGGKEQVVDIISHSEADLAANDDLTTNDDVPDDGKYTYF